MDSVSTFVDLLGQSARIINTKGFLGANIEALCQKRHDLRILIAL